MNEPEYQCDLCINFNRCAFSNKFKEEYDNIAKNNSEHADRLLKSSDDLSYPECIIKLEGLYCLKFDDRKW